MNNNKIIPYIKNIVPAKIYECIRILFVPKVKWGGDYKSWEDAVRLTEGYNDSDLFEKVCNATLSVLNNKAVYERDSVLFYEHEYNHKILPCLLYIAIKENGSINVLDYGGSLGSTYFQNRKLLNNITSLRWNIVEQSHFVE